MTTPLEAAEKFFGEEKPWWLENMVLRIMEAYDSQDEYEYAVANFGDEDDLFTGPLVNSLEKAEKNRQAEYGDIVMRRRRAGAWVKVDTANEQE